jgi:hypothetical protein
MYRVIDHDPSIKHSRIVADSTIPRDRMHFMSNPMGLIAESSASDDRRTDI